MGRPRSAEAHRKVLDAAATLFAERGIDATSMDAIAENSTVSKATIYKHWPDKEALCLEVLAHIHGLDEEQPAFNTGDFRQDLIERLRYQPAADRQEIKDRIWPHLMAYSSRHPIFGNAWRARLMEPTKRALLAMFKRGEQEGILRSGINHEAGFAILLGPLIYKRIFVQRTGEKPPKDLESYVADAFLGAFGKATSLPEKKRK
jgi:AcrR family transcriptional regulator